MWSFVKVLRRNGAPVLAAITLAVALAGPAAAKTVVVDCTRGDSIEKALARPGAQVDIVVRGTCVENVRIERDDVRLRGDGGKAGIQARDAALPAVVVAGAARVAISDLAIFGGLEGVRVIGPREGISLSRLRLVDNGGWGLAVVDAQVLCEECVLNGNGTGGATVTQSGRLVLVDAEIDQRGSSFGVFAQSASDLNVVRGTIAADRGAVLATGGSGATVREASLTAQTHYALWVSNVASAGVSDSSLVGGSFGGTVLADAGAQVTMAGGSLAGPFGVAGVSRLALAGVTQTSAANAATSGNEVTDHSRLRTQIDNRAGGGGNRTTLAGDTALSEFSNGSLLATDAGNLFCTATADLECGAGTVRASSSCGSCP